MPKVDLQYIRLLERIYVRCIDTWQTEVMDSIIASNLWTLIINTTPRPSQNNKTKDSSNDDVPVVVIK